MMFKNDMTSGPRPFTTDYKKSSNSTRYMLKAKDKKF